MSNQNADDYNADDYNADDCNADACADQNAHAGQNNAHAVLPLTPSPAPGDGQFTNGMELVAADQERLQGIARLLAIGAARDVSRKEVSTLQPAE